MHDSGGYTSSSDTSSHHSSTSSHSSDTSWGSSHTPHTSPGYTGSDGISPAQFYPTLNQAQFSDNSGFSRSSGGGMSVGLIVLAVMILIPIVITLIAFLSMP